MRKKRGWILAPIASVLIVVIIVFWRPVLFVGGGGFITLGHALQEQVHGFKRVSGDETPQEVLESVLAENEKASWVRAYIPQADQKPQVLLILCIDPRLDGNVVVGDSRDYYDIMRLPGSILSEEAIESVELSVLKHNVKVVLFTTHTDCAMEAVAKSEYAAEFPALSRGVNEREAMFEKLLNRPVIAERIANGTLLVERLKVDTETQSLIPQ